MPEPEEVVMGPANRVGRSGPNAGEGAARRMCAVLGVADHVSALSPSEPWHHTEHL